MKTQMLPTYEYIDAGIRRCLFSIPWWYFLFAFRVTAPRPAPSTVSTQGDFATIAGESWRACANGFFSRGSISPARRNWLFLTFPVSSTFSVLGVSLMSPNQDRALCTTQKCNESKAHLCTDSFRSGALACNSPKSVSDPFLKPRGVFYRRLTTERPQQAEPYSLRQKWTWDPREGRERIREPSPCLGKVPLCSSLLISINHQSNTP